MIVLDRNCARRVRAEMADDDDGDVGLEQLRRAAGVDDIARRWRPGTSRSPPRPRSSGSSRAPRCPRAGTSSCRAAPLCASAWSTCRSSPASSRGPRRAGRRTPRPAATNTNRSRRLVRRRRAASAEATAGRSGASDDGGADGARWWCQSRAPGGIGPRVGGRDSVTAMRALPAPASQEQREPVQEGAPDGDDVPGVDVAHGACPSSPPGTLEPTPTSSASSLQRSASETSSSWSPTASCSTSIR